MPSTDADALYEVLRTIVPIISFWSTWMWPSTVLLTMTYLRTPNIFPTVTWIWAGMTIGIASYHWPQEEWLVLPIVYFMAWIFAGIAIIILGIYARDIIGKRIALLERRCKGQHTEADEEYLEKLRKLDKQKLSAGQLALATKYFLGWDREFEKVEMGTGGDEG